MEADVHLRIGIEIDGKLNRNENQQVISIKDDKDGEKVRKDQRKVVA